MLIKLARKTLSAIVRCNYYYFSLCNTLGYTIYLLAFSAYSMANRI